MTDELLHRRIAQVVARQPTAPAVSDSAGTCDYQALWHRSGELAARLREAGRGPGGVVVVCAEKSVDVVATALAAWRNGAAYLPVDPRTPTARVARLVSRLPRASALATTSALAGRFAGQPDLLLDRHYPPAADSAEPVTYPGDLAYLIHTSGSTGEPKLVAVSHRSLLSSYDSWDAALGLRGLASYLQAAPLGFDVHVADLARALLSGAHLVMCPAATVLDPRALHALISKHQVEAALMTPSVWRLLLDWLEHTGHKLESLRQLAVGGEAWTVDELRRLRAVTSPGCRLLSFYGVAEASVDSSYADLSAAPDPEEIPLGRPFDGTRMTVRDADLRPVGSDTAGEVYLAGQGLARGYYQDPGQTASRFVPDPDGPPGTRMYRTGDLVHLAGDGALLYRGRADDQVKVRGTRIQLAEVDAALRAHPGVSAASSAVHQRGGESVLVGYVVADRAVSASDVRRDAARLLPDAMVPAVVVHCQSLPLTRSGKVDRGALPDWLPAAGDGPAGQLSPAAAIVARTWERLLGTPPRAADDDFFAAGGTSLTAAYLAVGIGIDCGIRLPVGAVFSDPTLAGLTASLARAAAADAEPGEPASAVRDATPDQARMWLVTRLRRQDAAYHIPMLIDISGEPARDVLRESLRRLVQLHQGLRAVFWAGPDGRVAQRLLPAGTVDLTEADLRSGPGTVDQEIAERVTRPFDVESGPLLRASLLRVGQRRWRLLLVAHHLVLDGWSERLLLRDLGRLYSALLAGQEPAVEAASYERALAIAARPVIDQASREYWRQVLADPPAPPALPGAGAARRGGTRQRLTLNRERVTALRAISRQHRTTLFAAMLAVLAGLLSRWSGQDDVIIGAPFGDRDRAELQDVIGMFVSTQALRVSVDGRPAFTELVDRAARAVAGAMVHREVPFDQVVHDLGRSGASGANPLFRVWLNLLGPPAEAPRMTGLATEMVKAPVDAPLFDLCLYLTEREEDLDLDLVYDRAAIDDADALAFLTQFAALATACAADPLAHVGQHDLRTGAEADARQDADLRAATPPALLGRLGAMLRDDDGQVAIRSGQGTWTRRDVAGVAQAVAAGLTAAGVTPGTVVPVLASRDPRLIPALLGVLSADAVFTVIDAELPADRVRELVALTGARIGLSAALPGTRPEPGCRWLAVPDAGPGSGTAAPWAPSEPVAGGYLAFTSGTTGRPGRVRAGAAPLAHFLSWYTRQHGMGAGDRFALASGLGYDPLLRDALTPLWVGGTLSVPSEAVLKSPRELLAWLAAERITVLHLTPQLARLLTLAADSRQRLPDLRLVCCGGDDLRTSDVAGIRQWSSHAVILNAYGTTETPQVVACHVVDQAAATGTVPIGRAAPGAELLVQAAEGRPAAVGEVGRLLVRGPYLATAVLDGDGLADDAVPGHRRFDTGDLARRLADGTVELLGRADSRVKVSGHRADPLQTDRLLRAHPAVSDCVTLPVRGPDGDYRLHSYAVATEGADADALHGYLRRSLPGYQVPASVSLLESLPLNGNGKLDRAALAMAGRAAATAREPGTPPRTRLEQQIAAVWERVQQAPVTATDRNFFDLGGSSLTLVRVQLELERLLGQPVSIADLFEHPTVQALARYLERSAESKESASRPPVPREHVRAMRERRLAARNATQDLKSGGREA